MSYRPNPHCPQCRGVGFLHPRRPDGTPDHTKVIPCDADGCLLDSLWAMKTGAPSLRHHGVTEPDQTFETFQKLPGTLEAFNHAKALADGSASFVWLLVYGGTGCGKTHLCNALACALIERGAKAKVIAAADLFAELRAGIGDNTIEERIRKYKHHPFLILDDWGVEYGTEWEEAKLDEIMTSRYATGKRTVLTSNRDIADLPARIQSRFKDRTMSRMAHNAAPDYRVTGPQRRTK